MWLIRVRGGTLENAVSSLNLASEDLVVLQ